MTPFLSGLLSLAEADVEAAFIPAGQTFLDAVVAAKGDRLARAAAVAQLEGNLLVSASTLEPEFIAQTLPLINATLQSTLAKAQATIAAAAAAVAPKTA